MLGLDLNPFQQLRAQQDACPHRRHRRKRSTVGCFSEADGVVGFSAGHAQRAWNLAGLASIRSFFSAALGDDNSVTKSSSDAFVGMTTCGDRGPAEGSQRDWQVTLGQR